MDCRSRDRISPPPPSLSQAPTLSLSLPCARGRLFSPARYQPFQPSRDLLTQRELEIFPLARQLNAARQALLCHCAPLIYSFFSVSQFFFPRTLFFCPLRVFFFLDFLFSTALPHGDSFCLSWSVV